MRYRILICLALTAFILCPASARVRNFTSSCGKQKTSIVWDGNIVKTGSQTEYYTSGADGKTTEWRLVDKSAGTDVRISMENGYYIITGTYKGDKVNRKEKSKGNPWYQKIEMNGYGPLKGCNSFKYECFGARDLKFYVMSATDKGPEKIEGKNAFKVKSTLANGLFAGMWSCNFFFDGGTSEYIAYKSVEGAPGTPETTIICID